MSTTSPLSPKGATHRAPQYNVASVGLPFRGSRGEQRELFVEMAKLKTDMFYCASPQIFENARMLRDNMTMPEVKLWEKLRNKQLSSYKFRRQHPINEFIADFYCHELRLVIEVDGKYHEENEQMDYDKARTEILSQFGVSVLRFTNEEIDQNIEMVIDQVRTFISKSNKQ